jgi:hypothetical protein
MIEVALFQEYSKLQAAGGRRQWAVGRRMHFPFFISNFSFTHLLMDRAPQ